MPARSSCAVALGIGFTFLDPSADHELTHGVELVAVRCALADRYEDHLLGGRLGSAVQKVKPTRGQLRN